MGEVVANVRRWEEEGGEGGRAGRALMLGTVAVGGSVQGAVRGTTEAGGRGDGRGSGDAEVGRKIWRADGTGEETVGWRAVMWCYGEGALEEAGAFGGNRVETGHLYWAEGDAGRGELNGRGLD